MKFISTKSQTKKYNFSEAIVMGLAPDGGLFIPETFPQIDTQNVNSPADVLKPFFSDDPLLDHLEGICEEAFNFDFPLVELDENLSVLELFHGPTSAFKDFGARFLAECMKKLAELKPGLKKNHTRRNVWRHWRCGSKCLSQDR